MPDAEALERADRATQHPPRGMDLTEIPVQLCDDRARPAGQQRELLEAAVSRFDDVEPTGRDESPQPRQVTQTACSVGRMEKLRRVREGLDQRELNDADGAL